MNQLLQFECFCKFFFLPAIVGSIIDIQGGTLVFQAGYHPHKRTFKTHPKQVFSGMKIDPKYAFCMRFS